jgi:hypothetical protein
MPKAMTKPMPKAAPSGVARRPIVALESRAVRKRH